MSLVAPLSPRRLAALLVAPVLLAPLVVSGGTPAAAVSPDLVVSQVYGGGGNTGAPYTHDFIEIFNRGSGTASLTGMSLQYASATGTGHFGANAGQLTELPAVTVAPGAYFLVAEAGGAVGAPLTPDHTDPTPIAMGAAAGKVALVTGTTSLGCNGGSTAPCDAAALSRIVDLVGYGTANFFEGAAAAPAASNTTAVLRANGGRTDTDHNGADFTAGTPTPRGSSAPPPPPEPPVCAGPGATKVSAVQGSGSSTPMSGSAVEVEAVVTAVRPGLGGYLVQEEPADEDGDPVTSEGVFVSGSLPAAAGEGDLVRVRGTAGEEFGRTRLVASVVSVCAQGVTPAPATVVVEFPVATGTYLERHEGMLVRLPQPLVISEYFNFGRFNETVVGLPMPGRDRFDTPTAVVEPGPDAVDLTAQYALRRITLDDGRNSQNASPPYFPGSVNSPFNLANTFRGGDTLTGITGVLDWSFSRYRVHPTADAAYTSANPRPADPPVVGGEVKVASFNVLNYFLTLDQGAPACGPEHDLNCRGANTEEERLRQRAKIVDAIASLDAAVVGLMEMENTTGVEPAADLVAGLNDLLGAGTYDYVDTGVIGTDAIRLGLIYQTATVRPAGQFAVLDSTVDPRFIDTRNRPTLAQTFDTVSDGSRLTVAVNHLKSKGSSCSGDPDRGDGQGNCNVTRTEAAAALADWLADDPTGSGDPDRLIIGDLNAYDHEDPIDELVDAGYTDLLEQFGGEHAYSYVFDGQVGYLDHGLASASLAGQVTGAADWHTNADEPTILDYDMTFKGPDEDALYEPNAFRASDHDPVLIGLDLAPATVGSCYADGSQTVDALRQGRRANGTGVPSSMSDPQQSLGHSDPGEEPYWTTLGLGGELVIEFARPVQNNNLGAADLRVVDAPDGAKGFADRADVYASFDGVVWHQVGTVSGTGTVDLGALSSARFVQVVDTTPPAGLPTSADGFDLDAMEVLSGCSV